MGGAVIRSERKVNRDGNRKKKSEGLVWGLWVMRGSVPTSQFDDLGEALSNGGCL